MFGPDHRNDTSEPSRARTLHEAYIAVIAAMLFVELATAKVGNNSAVANLIAFAATMSSLILGVVAIFITLKGNGDIAQSLTRVDTASQSVVTEANKIASASILLQDGVSKYVALTDRVSLELESLSSKVLNVQTKVDVVSEILTKDQPSLSATADGSSTQRTAASDADHLKANSPTEFLARSSVIGDMCMYCAARLAGTHKTLEAARLSSALNLVATDYIVGFMVASSASGLISAHTSDGETTVKRTSFLASDAENAISHWIDLVQQDGGVGQLTKQPAEPDIAIRTVQLAFSNAKAYVEMRLSESEPPSTA